MAKGEEKSKEELEDEQRVINNEYKIWKKNRVFMYDLEFRHVLEWPSLTVQWFPERFEIQGGDHFRQRLVLGTYTAGEEPNHLMIAQAQLPKEGTLYDARKVDPKHGGVGPHGSKVSIIKQIIHEGEINRARHMPQHPFIIATKTVSAEVHVFDTIKHPPKPPEKGKCNPDLRLKGHVSEGMGLSWSVLKQGHILSGSDDSLICLWDINAKPENKSFDPLQTFKTHEGAVQDVDWHLKNEYLFGSVGDDQHLLIWDLRTQTANKPVHSVVAHKDRVNSIAFNPFNQWTLATGSSDKTVNLFDLRKINTALHTFESHTQEVEQVGWNPKIETVLASSCLGRRIFIWDLARIGDEQTEEEAEDGPPELLFIHGGHTSNILDFSWNPCEPWAFASVAADNILQVWQMAHNIYHVEGEKLPEEMKSTS